MSERIRLLADQSDKFADDKVQMPGEYHPDWHDIRDEEFARLIAYECMDLALGSSHREDDMGAIIANKIKKYFGIER